MENNNGESFFKEEFISSFDAMTGVLDRAVDAIKEHGWVGPDRVACTRLCLEEALVNAVRHGNKGDAASKVFIDICDRGDYCQIRVRDEGEGFNADDIELPGCEELGGRGICLIRHFMDYVGFNEAEHCLEMHFRRKACCEEE